MGFLWALLGIAVLWIICAEIANWGARETIKSQARQIESQGRMLNTYRNSQKIDTWL